ncbi:MAG: DUF1538 domain-containing protein [Oscillospiraceae bacterium]|jgi:hypothetical protein|nr:DUF1538 domain-containing protein [Oscillospiraceae bacterium]
MKITHTKHNKFTDSLSEVVKSLIPIIAIIVSLMVVLTFFVDLPPEKKIDTELWASFIGGTFMVIFGMSLFLFGSGRSMMNFGSKAGGFIFKKGKLPLILFFGFFLGYLVTNAEPDLLVLSRQVAGVNPNIHKTLLISVISVGTGLFLSIALFRIVYKIHLVKVLFFSYSVVFATAIISMFIAPDLVALSFDSSGVTTGPVTVPFILAFAAGASQMLKGEQESNPSFGMVGITSVGAIIATLLLGVYFK